MHNGIDATFVVSFIGLDEENADFRPKSGLKKWVLAGKYAIAYKKNDSYVPKSLNIDSEGTKHHVKFHRFCPSGL